MTPANADSLRFAQLPGKPLLQPASARTRADRARRLVAMGADDLDHNVGVHPMVFPAVFDDSNGIGFLPPVIDESIQLGCIVLPLLCLLWTLAERAFRCCCPKCCRPSARVAPDPLADVGISNLDVPALHSRSSAVYSPDQRERDRAEERYIRERASEKYLLQKR